MEPPRSLRSLPPTGASAAWGGPGPAASDPCPLCAGPGGLAVWSDDRLRVIRVDDTPGFPAFYRVVWMQHVREMSELSQADLHHCIDAVAAVERTVRAALLPTKMNVATLGNMVAHLHWHVIARFLWDSHFPNPIWAAAQREPAPGLVQVVNTSLPDLDRAVAAALAGL